MELLATHTTAKNYHPHWDAMNTILLNHEEVKCLEMALYFLTEQLQAQTPHFVFTEFRNYHLVCLNHWLNQAKCKKQLRFGSQCQVSWPIYDLRGIQWLALALEVGISEETIIAMAVDEANYQRDMAMRYAETDDDYCAADEAFYRHFQVFQQYYSRIAQSSQGLLAKFQQILAMT